MDRHFAPQMEAAERTRKYAGWQAAVAQALHRPG